MEQTKTRENEMLDKIFKNAKMGSDSIVKIMPKVSSENLKKDLTIQLDGYEKIASKARKKLLDSGAEVKEENIMTKMWASVGMYMNTMMDSSDNHIAEMVTEGSTMGVTDTLKILREYENTDVSEETLQLARNIIKFEESNIEKMKSYI